MAKIFTILTERDHYTARTSMGKMYFVYVKDYVQQPLQYAKDYFGYTLEDTARPGNIKVMKETCLPGGLKCKVSLYESDHYKKTIIFHTEDDKRTIKIGPLTWVGCLAHGGQTHKDTEGCVLVARNKINDDMIQGSLKDELRRVIKAGSGTGSFRIHIPISVGTWHVRSYATNESGTSYGSDETITATSQMGIINSNIGIIDNKKVIF